MIPETLLRVPRLGESVCEARILLFCKKPGDSVSRDEPLLEIETDKAAYVMESPEDGVVDRWDVEPGAVLPVGHVIGAIRTGSPGITNHVLSPRARAWCNEHGLTREAIDEVRALAPDQPLTIAALERWIRPQDGQVTSRDFPLTPNRMALNRVLEHARQHAVPAWIEMDLPWNEVDRARASQVPRRGAIEVLALAVIQAMCACPAFRSELKGDVLREYSVPVLGVSVALPDDELGTAVICGNDNVESLAAELKKQLELTRQGAKSPLRPQVLLSYVAPLGITAAMPVVVPPAVATLCVGAHGATLDRTGKRTVKSATMILGFDHRVCNGAGAAQFLKRVVEAIKNLAGDS